VTALGVVYGDIGTSPIYSIRESFHHSHGVSPTPDNVLGVLSLIVWSLLIVICLKYLVFVVRADHHGEGGILALTNLVEHSKARQARGFSMIALLGLFGTALLYGDGMLTPAISVLSAVEGLAVVTPLFEPYVIPITLAILVVVFLGQFKGTARVGALFGPVVGVWLLTLSGLGLSHIVRAPEVLVCANPYYALDFFLRNGWPAFLVLGSVFLVVTGGEALYADMGHFGRKAVRVSWFSLVFPALLINYLGQGALLLHHPEAVVNPFFLMAPKWALPLVVAITTAATVIASQALISGAFSLTMQAVQHGYLPRLKVEHTSELERGQIYVPAVNWMLLVSCCSLVLGFGSSSRIAAAYGVAVTLTMIITTLLFFYLVRYSWEWPLWKAALICGSFLSLEMVYFLANMTKLADGGWFPLVVGAIFFSVLSTWRKGRAVLGGIFLQRSVPLHDLIAQVGSGQVQRVPGVAVFMYGNPQGTPPALLSNLKHNHVLHEKVAIVAVKVLEQPFVPADRQLVEVTDRGHGFYRVQLQFGYMDEPKVPQALARVQVDGQPLMREQETSYFLGRETLLPRRWISSGMSFWREHLFAGMSRNAQDATAFFHIPTDRVVELGTQIEF
jgi:KUP system potassium uptake protein